MTPTIVFPTGFGIFFRRKKSLWQNEFFDEVGHGKTNGQVD